MNAPSQRIAIQGYRYLVVGGINTAFTFVLFILLVQLLPPQPAYAIAYSVGLIFAYFANARWVFGAPLALGSAVAYPLLYAAQYLMNAALLQWFGSGLGWPPWLALAAALCFTVPILFVLNRRLFASRRP